MRLAIIAPPWLPVPPRAYGGTEAVLDRLARGLSAAGHDVTLIGHADSTCPVERFAPLRSPPDEPMGTSAVELRYVIGAYRHIASERFDLVHDHSLLGLLHNRRPIDLPVVTTNHGPFNDELVDIYRTVDAEIPIIAISHEQARVARARSVRVTAVIHHGVDVGEFPAGRGRGGYLVHLGRMAPEKGVHRAIDVARRAGYPLRIAAKMREPRERAYFERAVRPRLGRHIEYLGELDTADKLELLADATALVNPIRWCEPFGMVMLESLACGTPVLAFREGAAPEIVGDGSSGFLCRDEAHMAAMVEAVLDLDRTECRARVRDHFSTGLMVERHVEVFEDTIARHAGHTLTGTCA
jgi:glycosyltransferase involved in cell wall biosynthesis